MRLRFLISVALVVVLSAGAPALADSGDVAHDGGLQWGLDTIGAERAWDTSRGDGVTIAVIDSGVALDHEDLVDQLVPGVACLGTGGDPDRCSGSAQDDDGHGTHVAGIAAARTGNGVGVAGVAPDARIMPIKVLFRSCPGCPPSGDAEDVAAAVRWAARHGADVINLSLGSTTSAVFGPSFSAAVEDAWTLGAIPVVAAGNDYVLTADLGDAPAVIVSATARGDVAPAYSDGVGSARWALAAPGGDGTDTSATCAQDGLPKGILSTYWAADEEVTAYACLSGTSMAAPHVSGTLALLLAQGLSPEQAVRRVLDTAVDLGVPGPDRLYGAGRLDAAAALRGPSPVTLPTSTPGTDGVPIAPSTVVADIAGETSAPQLFVEVRRPSAPPGLVAVAVLAILGCGAAASTLYLRNRRAFGT